MKATTEQFMKDVEDVRQVAGALTKSTQALRDHKRFEEPLEEGQNSGEAKANIMLALRHLEDANFRLGMARMKMLVHPPIPADLAHAQE